LEIAYRFTPTTGPFDPIDPFGNDTGLGLWFLTESADARIGVREQPASRADSAIPAEIHLIFIE
jgi:hypothetical protein